MTHVRCHINAHENLRFMMKTIWRSDEKWLRYQRIASKIFTMLNLLLHAIASN